MKKLIYIVLAAAAIAASSCNEEGKITPAPTPEPEKAVEALNGVFTAGRRQVRFAPGNLLFDDGKWVMEKSQAACSETADGSKTSHFAWAEDFGKAYCTDNSLAEGAWSTLSSAEWKCLLETRTMASGAERYSLASGLEIEGTAVSGLFLYPDDYSGSTVDASFTWKSIDEGGIVFLSAAGMVNGTWKGVDDAGIIFLPSLGMGADVEVAGRGVYGRYWASDKLNQAIAYNIAFGPSGVSAFNAFGTYALYSVRLVRTN